MPARYPTSRARAQISITPSMRSPCSNEVAGARLSIVGSYSFAFRLIRFIQPGRELSSTGARLHHFGTTFGCRLAFTYHPGNSPCVWCYMWRRSAGAPFGICHQRGGRESVACPTSTSGHRSPTTRRTRTPSVMTARACAPTAETPAQHERATPPSRAPAQQRPPSHRSGGRNRARERRAVQRAGRQRRRARQQLARQEGARDTSPSGSCGKHM